MDINDHYGKFSFRQYSIASVPQNCCAVIYTESIRARKNCDEAVPGVGYMFTATNVKRPRSFPAASQRQTPFIMILGLQ